MQAVPDASWVMHLSPVYLQQQPATGRPKSVIWLQHLCSHIGFDACGTPHLVPYILRRRYALLY